MAARGHIRAAHSGLSVDLAQSTLELPLVPVDTTAVSFPEPDGLEPIPITVPDEAPGSRPERVVRYDVAAQETVLEVDPRYGGTRQYPDGLTFLEDAEESYRIVEGEGMSPWATTRWRITLAKPGWRATIETATVLAAEAGAFVYTAEVSARAEVEGVEQMAFDRSYRDVIPRTST